MISFNNHTEDEFELTVKDIKRSILPPVKNRFKEMAGRDGAYDFGSFVGMRVFEIIFQIKGAIDKVDLHGIAQGVTLWLYPADKLAKVLQFDDEPEFYYYAKVDGDTPMGELFKYGTFTVRFYCPIPWRFSTTQVWIPQIAFTRNSTAWEEIFDGDYPDPEYVATDIPRYFSIVDSGLVKGLFIEEESTNEARRPLFDAETSEVPNDWTGYIVGTGTTGTHDTDTVNGVYTANITANADTAGRVGIYESSTGLGQHIVDTDIYWSVRIRAKFVSGTTAARLRVNVFDSGFVLQHTDTIIAATGSHAIGEWFDLEILNKNYADQYLIGIYIDSYANGDAGATGAVSFEKPQLEFGKYLHTFHSGTRAVENAFTNVLYDLPRTWGLGITLYPRWGKTDLEVDVLWRRVAVLFADADNKVSINWNPSAEKFKAGIWIGGVETALNLPSAPAFVAGDKLKMYLHRDGDRVKFYFSVNDGTPIDSGYVYDTQAQTEFTILYIGNEQGNNHINGTLSNLVFETTPQPELYFNI